MREKALVEIFTERAMEVPDDVTEVTLIRMFPYTYIAYKEMVGSLLDPRHPLYPYYGARRLSFEESWLESFKAFLEEVGPAPTDLEGGH